VIDDHSRLFICSHAYTNVKARDASTASTAPPSSTGYPQRCCPTMGGVQRQRPPWQGAAVNRARAARSGRQELTAYQRLHQTLKRYLDKQQPPGTLKDLQRQLDAFVPYYNDIHGELTDLLLQASSPTTSCASRAGASADGGRRGRRVACALTAALFTSYRPSESGARFRSGADGQNKMVWSTRDARKKWIRYGPAP
jgi:hypothetical protein